MPVYLRPCSKCLGKTTGRTDRKNRKKCEDCRWQAVAPPSLGRKSLGAFRTKEEAEGAERRALVDHENGIDLQSKTVTFADIASRFFKAVRTNLSPATIARYEEHWRMHIEPTLGAMLITKLKQAHVNELYTKLQSEPVPYVRRIKNVAGKTGNEIRFGKSLGPNTVLRVHRLLHRMFVWAEKNGLVSRNVIRSAEAPKATRSPAKALSADQVAALLQAAEGTRLHSFWVVSALTGLRRGEVGALTWDAIDIERATLIVRQAIGEDRKGGTFIKSTKSDRERSIPLSDGVLSALRAQRAAQAAEKMLNRKEYDDKDLVFADPLGGLLDLDAVSKAFSALAGQIGVKAKGISLHSLRHFGASQALANGSDVRTVAALLGHASASTTLNVYGHVVAGAQERATTAIGDALSQAQARRAGGQNRPA